MAETLTALRARVPGLAAVASYDRRWLPKDVVAGLVLSALLVPQGMAYAELAGLPPITGLYTSILCLLGYAVLRAVPGAGAGSGLLAGPDDRGDDRAAGAGGRRPGPGGRTGVDAGDHGRARS